MDAVDILHDNAPSGRRCVGHGWMKWLCDFHAVELTVAEEGIVDRDVASETLERHFELEIAQSLDFGDVRIMVDRESGNFLDVPSALNAHEACGLRMIDEHLLAANCRGDRRNQRVCGHIIIIEENVDDCALTVCSLKNR